MQGIRKKKRNTNLFTILIALNLIGMMAGCNVLESKKTNPGPVIIVEDVNQSVASANVLSGKISLSGFISYEKNTASSRTLQSKHLAASETPDCGAGGKVILFDTNDTGYTVPLTREIAVDPETCAYDVSEEDFLNETHGADFIVKTVVEDSDGKAYELSAISTEKARQANDTVLVDPLTTMVKVQIIKSIKSIFGESFALDESILDSISSLVAQIVKKIQAENLTFDLEDYKTSESADVSDSGPVKGVYANQESLANKMIGTSVSGELAAFNSQLGANREELYLANISEADIRPDKDGLLKETIARIKYNLIASFAQLGFSVHDGKGKLIVLLPVPYEERNKLPGKIFTITAKNADGNVTIGDNFALRRVDVLNDLKNITGNETWLWPLADAMMYRDVIPEAGIKAIMKNIDHETKLSTVGKAFSVNAVYTPSATQTATQYFDGLPDYDNMFLLLNGVTLDAGDIAGSVKSILEPYKKALFIQEYEALFYDIVYKAINESSGTSFDASGFLSKIDIVTADSGEEFDNAVTKFENAGYLNGIYQDAAGMITASLPMSKKSAWSDSVIRFKGGGLTIDTNTTVTPKSSLALISLMNLNQRLNKITVQKVNLGALFDWNNDITGDADLNNTQVWLPVWKDDSTTTTSSSGFTSFFTFITGMMDKAAAGATDQSSYDANLSRLFKEESSFATLKENIATASGKLESKLFNDNGGAIFVDTTARFGDFDEQNASLQFTVMKGENEPNTEIKSFKLTPIAEDRRTYEWYWLDDEAKTVSITGGNVAMSDITLYNIEKDASTYTGKLYDWDGNEVTGVTNTIKYNGMFRFEFVDGDDVTTAIGEFPLFPGENKLNNIFFGGADLFFADNGASPAGGSEIRYLAKGEMLFYPGIEKRSLTADPDGSFPLKEVVGEDFAQLNSSGALEALTSGVLKGALNGATVTFKKLANNWTEQTTYWESTDKSSLEAAASTISSLQLSSWEQEGTLLLVELNATATDFQVNQRLLMNITFVDLLGSELNGVELELMQHPDDMVNDWIGPDLNDLWGSETNVTTTVKFSVESTDPAAQVTGVKFVPILKNAAADFVNFFDPLDQTNIYINKTLGTSATNTTGSDYEVSLTLYKDKNVSIDSVEYLYTEMYAVYATILKDGVSSDQELMRVAIFPDPENWLGTLFIDPNAGDFFEPVNQVSVVAGSFVNIDLAGKALIFADPFAAFKLIFNANGIGTYESNMMTPAVAMNWVKVGDAVKITYADPFDPMMQMEEYVWIVTPNNDTLTQYVDTFALGFSPDVADIFTPEHDLTYFGTDLSQPLPATTTY